MLGIKKNPYRDLEKALGYRFKDRSHLEAALTHRSFRYETTEVEIDNQRLEFLGDAALGLAAGEYLFHLFEDQAEGTLTSARSKITSGRALAEIAREIRLGDYIKVGRGEERTGGRERASNLADALESVLGAAYLDGGNRAVAKIFKKIFAPKVATTAGEAVDHNPKGKLQELAQRKYKSSPVYRVVREDGPPHDREYEVEAVLDGDVLARATGSSKRTAEARAASAALGELADD